MQVFTEKWDNILEKVDKGCDGKSYLENISKKLEDLRGSFDDRTAFDEMETKYKAQLEKLQKNLRKEREQAVACAGDNSELKCKLAMLEDQLEDLRKENQETKEKLADEKIAKAREVNPKKNKHNEKNLCS